MMAATAELNSSTELESMAATAFIGGTQLVT